MGASQFLAALSAPVQVPDIYLPQLLFIIVYMAGSQGMYIVMHSLAQLTVCLTLQQTSVDLLSTIYNFTGHLSYDDYCLSLPAGYTAR